MMQAMSTIRRMIAREEGQDLLEYGLLAALIAFVAIAGITAVGTTINNVFWGPIGQAV